MMDGLDDLTGEEKELLEQGVRRDDRRTRRPSS